MKDENTYNEIKRTSIGCFYIMRCSNCMKLERKIEEQAKEINKKIDDSYSGNELCPICKEWFDVWIKELKDKI